MLDKHLEKMYPLFLLLVAVLLLPLLLAGTSLEKPETFL